MKHRQTRLRVGLLLVMLICSSVSSASQMGKGMRGSSVEYVNTLIGTGGLAAGIGSTPPGAQYPFPGMRLSPDTSDVVWVPWRHFGGYYYGDPYVRCVSHTHMQGSGANDLGAIGVMPLQATQVGAETLFNYGYKSRFTHDKEETAPGYYGVSLLDSGIELELAAAGKLSGVHRWTFPASNGSVHNTVVFNMGHSTAPNKGTSGTKNGIVSYSPDGYEVSGQVTMDGSLSQRFGTLVTYFYARLNRRIVSECSGTWVEGDKVQPQVSFVQGHEVGAYVCLEGSGAADTVEMAVAISTISVDMAEQNLAAELASSGVDESMARSGPWFDAARTAASKVWQNALDVVSVQDSQASHDDLVKLYSGLYHSFSAPSTYSETGGRYLGFDNKVHTLTGGQQTWMSDMSIWDIHRSQVSLLALLQPQVALDVARSLVEMAQQGGYMPRWPMANGYTNCMVGNHANVVLADIWARGLRDFSLKDAYPSMRDAAMNDVPHAGRADVADYIKLGYVPVESETRGAALTLAYAFDDGALAYIASQLNETADEALFRNRSRNYRNVWEPKSKFFCPRKRDGTFTCPALDDDIMDKYYTEGNAWQYRWFVPHDVPGLIELFGSEQEFVDNLSYFMLRSQDFPSTAVPNPFYWAGNEPDLLAPWMFNFAKNASHYTQQYARWQADNVYNAQADGIPGNDDYGELSSWLVCAYLGLYPLAGTDKWFVTSPKFEQVTMQLAGGKTLQVIGHGASTPGNVLIKRAEINGVPMSLDNLFVAHGDLLVGQAKLEMWLGPLSE